MNQDGAPNPKPFLDKSSGSTHEDTITNNEHIHRTLSETSNDIRKNNRPNLLSTCAKSDLGGGVGLNHEVFVIYSTAALPPLWTDILHSSTPPAGNISSTIERLRTLADKISVSLPIYTSWNDIRHSPSNHQTLEIHTLNTSPSLTTPPSTDPGHALIHRSKPHFLINAALNTNHCIIGQSNKTETLLVVLRRPWCVLEICVSSVHDVEVLEGIREFALVAQEVDGSGYGTVVFLLGVEIEARRRRHHLGRRQTVTTDYSWNNLYSHRDMIPYGKVYERCNRAVFIPSLRSFNSFWIRLICVCAIELGICFSCMIHMLCDQQQPPVLHDEHDSRPCRSDSVLSKTDIESCRHDGRRHSTTELCSFTNSRRIAEEGDIVQKMLDLYKHVLRRTEDYI